MYILERKKLKEEKKKKDFQIKKSEKDILEEDRVDKTRDIYVREKKQRDEQKSFFFFFFF